MAKHTNTALADSSQHLAGPPTAISAATLLSLLQLASPTLPVGAYSYSEGLETLVEAGSIVDAATLHQWLAAELQQGGLKLEGAVLVRAYQAVAAACWDDLSQWNHWWSAARETKELRQQSWQMGRSLSRLLEKMDPATADWLQHCSSPVNWAVVFGGAAAHWQVDLTATLTAFYQGWAGNLINAGVKLIPLGQTAGQQLLFNLTPCIVATVTDVLKLRDDELRCCSWGVALASSQHEIQRVRLFQS
ncbi:MAG: urease accessory protein UreF [Cyanobacteria bacterium J06632_22]